ncbi:unnamed protein product [Rangifer tarandus platyrhynchus]|uniref:Uncharacterized protein n=1 Tax=Rangifer tarandus platyrhynchus TaxID=3082113 RepID=A0AC59ZHW3_RANTA
MLPKFDLNEIKIAYLRGTSGEGRPSDQRVVPQGLKRPTRDHLSSVPQTAKLRLEAPEPPSCCPTYSAPERGPFPSNPLPSPGIKPGHRPANPANLLPRSPSAEAAAAHGGTLVPEGTVALGNGARAKETTSPGSPRALKTNSTPGHNSKASWEW